MTSIYEDDTVVADVTRRALEETGSRLLQIHRFDADETEHARRLLLIFDPPQNSRIADVGCGVGGLDELMRQQRPDLSFVLINKSKKQLGMCPEGFIKKWGEAEHLPLTHGEVDAVMAVYVLGHIDVGLFVTECVRIGVKHVYVFDLFRQSMNAPSRMETDLGYTDWTVDQIIEQFYDIGRFKVRTRFGTDWAPDKIMEMLPHEDTLKNTMSEALVFER